MNTVEGLYRGEGLKVALVCSRFNELITSRLVDGARDALRRHQVPEENIDIVWVPGAFEIPLAAQEAARSGRYQGVIALGAVIRGATPHFDYVAAEVTKGIAQVSLASRVPIMMGVLTTNTLEEALERAGTKSGNKGFDAALGVLEMADLIGQLG